MQRNRNKQKAEMSLFPSSTYFDTSASTTHLLASGDSPQSGMAGDVNSVGNLNPAFLGTHSGSPPPTNDSSSLLWGQRPIPHLANPAMIHRRRSGGEGIKERPKTRPKDPKDWFRDDHLISRKKKAPLDVLHFESDHEEDNGPLRELAFSDQPTGMDYGRQSSHQVPGGYLHGHDPRTDGVLLRAGSKGGQKAVSSAQRSKSSLSSLFQLGLNKKSNSTASAASLSAAAALLPSSRSLTSQQMLDTSPSTTDSDDSDLISSSSSSDSDSDSESVSSSCDSTNDLSDRELRRRNIRRSSSCGSGKEDHFPTKSSDEGHSSQNSGIDLMKLDEEDIDDPTVPMVTRTPSSVSGSKEVVVMSPSKEDEEAFHSANSDQDPDPESASNIAKNVRSSSLDLTTSANAAGSAAEDRMKRRINKRRTSNKDGSGVSQVKAGGRGGSSGIGSSNEDSIGSKERKQIAQVICGDVLPKESSDPNGRKERKTGSNVSTTSTASSDHHHDHHLHVHDGHKPKGKNLSNVSQVSSTSEGHRSDHGGGHGHHGKKRELSELSPEEVKRRMKVRRNLKLRRMKMRELIKTEKKFGNDLRLLHDIFYLPLKAELMDKKSPTLNQVEMDTLFANLLPLIELHKQLYRFFKMSIKPLISNDIKRDKVDYEEIGHRLVDMFSKLKPKLVAEFAFYCSIQEKQNEMLASKSGSSKFNTFRKTAEVMAKEVLNKLTLKDLLMAPVQRIMRYRLLIHAVFETFPVPIPVPPPMPPPTATNSGQYENYGNFGAGDIGQDQSVGKCSWDAKEAKRRRRFEEREAAGRAALEMAVKVVQEIAKGVDDKKAESERLDWIQKSLFPNVSNMVAAPEAVSADGQLHSGTRIITSMESLILEHEGPVDWKVPPGSGGTSNKANIESSKSSSSSGSGSDYIPVHLLLLRDFIVALSVSDVPGSGSSTTGSSNVSTTSSASGLSPLSSSGASSATVTASSAMSNRHLVGLQSTFQQWSADVLGLSVQVHPSQRYRNSGQTGSRILGVCDPCHHRSGRQTSGRDPEGVLPHVHGKEQKQPSVHVRNLDAGRGKVFEMDRKDWRLDPVQDEPHVRWNQLG